MAQMDHNEAVRLQAAEKYVLGEFPHDLREEYEEHFFDCAECAVDVKAIAAFADTARELLRRNEAASAEKAAAPARGGWFAWFRPIVAVPAFAVLLLVIGYQNAVTIPRQQGKTALESSQVFTSSLSLKKVDTLGNEDAKTADEGIIRVRPDESFALQFDFTPRRAFGGYICQLQDESGRSLLQVKIPGISANRELHFVVPGGVVRPGKYSLVLAGDPEADGRMNKENEVSRLPFAVEFHR
jgi:hypothetical protein